MVTDIQALQAQSRDSGGALDGKTHLQLPDRKARSGLRSRDDRISRNCAKR